MAKLWINTNQNWNALQTPYILNNIGIQTVSCWMQCVTSSEFVNFWNFRCRKRSKKGFLCSCDYWELSNLFLWISRNQRGFIYLLPKIVQWAKFEEKFFSDSKRLGARHACGSSTCVNAKQCWEKSVGVEGIVGKYHHVIFTSSRRRKLFPLKDLIKYKYSSHF